jgi:hypothetical protein
MTDESLGDATSLAEIFRRNEEYIRSLGLPQMMRPSGLGAEYEFPSDVSALKFSTLGDLQLKLTGYYTYLLGLIGREESELGAFEEVFEVRLWAEVAREKAAHEKVVAKEILRAICIERDPDLARLHRALIARRHRLAMLKAQASVYGEQLVRLSREQTRRETEANLRRTI